MIVTGTVSDGQVVLDDKMSLPNGTKVRVIPEDSTGEKATFDSSSPAAKKRVSDKLRAMAEEARREVRSGKAKPFPE